MPGSKGKSRLCFLDGLFITNESGDLVGLSKIQGLKHLNEAMDRYTGEGTNDITDFNGNVMASSSWEVVGTKNDGGRAHGIIIRISPPRGWIATFLLCGVPPG